MVTSQRGGSTEVGGRRIAWRSIGNGPPLLLVNGYAATAANWDPALLVGLSAAFELICPDNRGVGGSDLGGASEVRVEAMAADLEAVLDALAIDSLPVVGWSLGGFVVQRLAMRAPERVEALVLMATDLGGSAAVRAEPLVWERLVDRSGTAREQAARLISLLFPPDVAAEVDRRFGEVVAAARAGLAPAALAAQEAAMAAWYADDQAPASGPARVLIAHGSEDVVIPAANADLLAARWPDSRVERFEGGGHAFMAQAPARVAALIEDFAAR